MRNSPFLLLTAAVCLAACTSIVGLDEVPPAGTAGSGGTDSGTTSVSASSSGGVGGQMSTSSSTTSSSAASSSGQGGAGGMPSDPATSCDLPPGTKQKGITDCGPDVENCCTSLPVTGGTFYRNYDGVDFKDMTHPATVSTFRLDKYEVTVSRFRRFIEAVVGAGQWRPAAGSGKHVHLNGGQGLAAVNGGFEPGWNTAWNDELLPTMPAWTTALKSCNGNSGLNTWTEAPNTTYDDRPLTCVGWHQAYAFCIWDGGFLPSETEWNYAASGGDKQRVFPWGGTVAECDKFMSNEVPCPNHGFPIAVGVYPTGNSLFGQSDMSGNLYEWGLDTYIATLANPCVDCVQLTSSVDRVARGGGFVYGFASSDFHSAARPKATITSAYWDVGFRCARAPN